ncbi:hypothetical protein RYX36_002955 [Vicia faba]
MNQTDGHPQIAAFTNNRFTHRKVVAQPNRHREPPDGTSLTTSPPPMKDDGRMVKYNALERIPARVWLKTQVNRVWLSPRQTNRVEFPKWDVCLPAACDTADGIEHEDAIQYLSLSSDIIKSRFVLTTIFSTTIAQQQFSQILFKSAIYFRYGLSVWHVLMILQIESKCRAHSGCFSQIWSKCRTRSAAILTRATILTGAAVAITLSDPIKNTSSSLVNPRTTAKAFAKDVFINQERKLGAQRRSDTVLVSTINDVDQGSADIAFRTPLAPYEKSKPSKHEENRPRLQTFETRRSRWTPFRPLKHEENRPRLQTFETRRSRWTPFRPSKHEEVDGHPLDLRNTKKIIRDYRPSKHEETFETRRSRRTPLDLRNTKKIVQDYRPSKHEENRPRLQTFETRRSRWTPFRPLKHEEIVQDYRPSKHEEVPESILDLRNTKKSSTTIDLRNTKKSTDTFRPSQHEEIVQDYRPSKHEEVDGHL